MTGVLTYIAFVMILVVWCLGWMAMSLFVGSVLDIPGKVSIAAGVILGPLGLLYVTLAGIIQRRQQRRSKSTSTPLPTVSSGAVGDPFA